MTGAVDLGIIAAVWLADRIVARLAEQADKRRRHELAMAKQQSNGGRS